MKTINELIKERIQKTIAFIEEDKKTGHPRNFSISTEEEILNRINSSIPIRYKESQISDEYSEKIISSLENEKGIYFYGSVGTGKTYLLYALLRFIRISRNDMYCANLWNVPDMLSNFKKSFSDGGGGEKEIDGELKYNGFLLLDDFGAEKVTEWNTEIMYRLINHRYENQLLTFFASNLSLDEISNRGADRIASRIAEMCNVIKVAGKDRRLTSTEIKP